MHRLLVWTLLALAGAAAPAVAGTVLYATAATPGRIDGYCVGPNGALSPRPITSVDTVGAFPFRVIVAQSTRTLYVAENDRIEIFRIEQNGALGRTSPTHLPRPIGDKVNSADLMLDCNAAETDCVPTRLYIPERRADRIVAYELQPDGVPVVAVDPVDPNTIVPKSCVLGPGASGFENMVLSTAPTLASPLLYITARGQQTGVRVFRLDGNHDLIGTCLVPDDPSTGDDPDDCDCDTATNGDCPTDENFNANKDPNPYCNDDPRTSDDDNGTLIDCVGPIACERTDPVDGACATGTLRNDKCHPTPSLGSPAPPPSPPDPNAPLYERRAIPGAGAVLLATTAEGAQRLFVESRFNMRILGFDLTGGLFSARLRKDGDIDLDRNGFPVARQAPDTRTRDRIRYQDLTFAGTLADGTILGTEFVDGRVDGYRIEPNTDLRRGKPTRTTKKNVRTSPVRMLVPCSKGQFGGAPVGGTCLPELAALQRMLYVGAGQHDRIQAFRLRDNGLPQSKDPFSETFAIPNSFPNDVALAVIPGTCD